MSSPPHSRHRNHNVRRQSFFTRVKNAPGDWLLDLHSTYLALDHDKLQERISWPVALALNVLLISVNLGFYIDDPLSDATYDAYYRRHGRKSAFISMLKTMQMILISISFANALWLYTSKKNYRMLHRNLMERPSTPHLRIVEFQKGDLHWTQRFPISIVYNLVSRMFSLPVRWWQRRRQQGADNDDSGEDYSSWWASHPGVYRSTEGYQRVYQLSVWDPSIFCRNLLCWFSPAQALVLYCINDDNFHLLLPIAILVGVQVQWIVKTYQGLVKDKQILCEEVYREYDSKFVYPRIFVSKSEKATATTSTSTRIEGGLRGGSSKLGCQSAGTETSGQLKYRRDGDGRNSDVMMGSKPVGHSTLVSAKTTFPRRDFYQENISQDDSLVDWEGGLEVLSSSECEVSSDSSSDEYTEDDTDSETDEERSEDDEDDDEDGERSDVEGRDPEIPHPTNSLPSTVKI